jgi:hypothetical protein
VYTLKSILPALPLLEAGRVSYLLGRFVGGTKPTEATQFSDEELLRVAFFHWMTALDVDPSHQESIYGRWKAYLFAAQLLALGDSHHASILPRIDTPIYDYVEDEDIVTSGLDYETIICCDLKVLLSRFKQRCVHASSTPAQ